MNNNYGFELLWDKEVEELASRVRMFCYQKNGARVLSLENDDENKVFGITFRTPPKDSTGVAHILEHSVLCGSRKYPLKEPFVELLKGSLQTFLNAFTFPDKTCYPVASQNEQDFYNLIDVYLDAVFYPHLTPETFAQEGHHLELEAVDAKPAFKGVVYNEMKGAYSSPDSLLAEFSQRSLFPDNCYGLDSGGDPEEILDLSYEDFKAFHKKFYHPSNSFVFFYGDDAPEHRLAILDEYFKDFEGAAVESKIALQMPKRCPTPQIYPYPAPEGQNKWMVTQNWLLVPTYEQETNLGLRILERILLGMPASPLRRALLESFLGEDLAGIGLEEDLQQMYFSTGLKGVEEKDLQAVQNLIQDTLQDLVKQGIDPKTIEAALNTVEFEFRENNTGSMPRGLIVMLRALSTWLYEADPLLLLSFAKPLKQIKDRVAGKERYFEELIATYFLKNEHSTVVILQPDHRLEEKRQEKEGKLLAQYLSGKGSQDLQDLVERTRYLKELQERPDDPEDLSKIPSLKVSDLPVENKKIPLHPFAYEGCDLLFHDLETNGIVYLDLGLDFFKVQQKFLGYIPLVGRCLCELGTKQHNFIELSQLIKSKTGGIAPQLFCSALADQSGEVGKLFLRGKCLFEQVDVLLSLFKEIVFDTDFDQQERFLQIALEEKARMEEWLVPAGHQLVASRIKGKLNGAEWINEQFSGVNYLLFLRFLVEEVKTNWKKVLNNLLSIKRALVSRPGLVLNITVPEVGFKEVLPRLEAFLHHFSEQVGPVAYEQECVPGIEGMIIPAQVNYVGKGIDLYAHGYRFHGSSLVVNKYLRTSWLWEKIRVQGGAYGAFSMLERYSGIASFVSYRDPNVVQTIDVFDQTASFLEKLNLAKQDLDKAIIGTIGDLDKYLLPDAKGYVSMLRFLTRDSEERRQRMREEVLGTVPEDFKDYGQWLSLLKDRGLVAVLGSKTSLEEAQEKGLHFNHLWELL